MQYNLFHLDGPEIKGALFDLDGVIVDTAKYHYLAWKRLAAELGFDFSLADNERLKGVSRMESLEILIECGRKIIPDLSMNERQKEEAAARKNTWYVDYLYRLCETDMLDGAGDYLKKLRKSGIQTALGSASKNAPLILERLNIAGLFDAVIDGNSVSKSKPNPEVFLKCAAALKLRPGYCVVFEDALSGIEAAKAGGMRAIAVGKPELLPGADRYINCLKDMLA
ncbi:MAG: beta-phosphoglucomutase [Treponema sp.]|nr:beta-phosphoglucomutase [Treponema sp.]